MTTSQENGTHASADSEDDELPLTHMIAKVKTEREAASSDPPASAKESKEPFVVPKKEVKKEVAADDDDDDDDDLPIASLLSKSSENKAPDASAGKKRKRPEEENGKASSAGGDKEKKKEKVKSSRERDERPERATKKDNGSKPVRAKGKSSSGHSDVTQRFYSLTKGELVQKLLCRWWYAITWPDPSVATAPPEDYEALDGYPGVFVCVKGDQIGHVLDRRRMEDCPNFTNMSKKPADELKTLLKKALEEQLRQLKEHEGSNRKLEKRIKKEIEWTEKVNAKKADDEARREGFHVASSD